MKKSSLLLMLMGVASMIGAIFTAIKASKKEEMEEEKENETTKEKIIRKTVLYAPTIALTLAAIFCFTGANIISVNVAAGTGAVLETTNRINERYKDKVREFAGKKKEQAMRAEAVGSFTEDEEFKKAKIVKCGDGETEFYDIISKTRFKTSIPSIRTVQNEMNAIFDKDPRKNVFVPINTFYRNIGIDTIKGGDNLGFNKVDGPIEIGFYPTVLSDGVRCIVLMYRLYPKWKAKTSH